MPGISGLSGLKGNSGEKGEKGEPAIVDGNVIKGTKGDTGPMGYPGEAVLKFLEIHFMFHLINYIQLFLIIKTRGSLAFREFKEQRVKWGILEKMYCLFSKIIFNL